MCKKVILLVVTFLVMVLLPCTEQIETQEELTIKSASTEHCNFEDLCSPLCACQCCTSQWLAANYILVTGISDTYSYLPEVISRNYEQLTISIWDPPRIV